MSCVYDKACAMYICMYICAQRLHGFANVTNITMQAEKPLKSNRLKALQDTFIESQQEQAKEPHVKFCISHDTRNESIAMKNELCRLVTFMYFCKNCDSLVLPFATR